MHSSKRFLAPAVGLISLSLLLYELILVRIFSVVLFGPQAHLAIALALLGGGVGSILLQLLPNILPDTADQRSLRILMLWLAASVVAVLLYVTQVPLTVQSEIPPSSFQERSSNTYSIVSTPYLSLLLPLLAMPFAIGAVVIAGLFRDNSTDGSTLYGIDLVGAGVGSILFLGILHFLPATDGLFVPALLALCAAKLFSIEESGAVRMWINVALLSAIGLVLASIGTGREFFPIKYAAGYAESTILYSRWTPITRVSIFRNPVSAQESVVLDNGSASPIVTTREQQSSLAAAAARGLVYTLHPPGRAAIIGASAGPDVAVAQHYGYTDILAIDLAGEIFPLVKNRYADTPYNPYLQPGTLTRDGDGRAIVLQDPGRFDVIQIVHANIWSLAGVVSNVWSPALLETKEAFAMYLDKLNPDGTLSVAKGSDTVRMIPALLEALRERGVTEDPWRYIAFVHTNSTVLLVKPRPWTAEERGKIIAFGDKEGRRVVFSIDPLHGPTPEALKKIGTWPVLTDDRPYSDTPLFWREFRHWMLSGENPRFPGRALSDAPLAYTYSIFAVQFCIVALLGAGVLFGPLLLSTRARFPLSLFTVTELLYFFSVGFGFIGLELTLMNRWILFINHPAYLVSLVLFAVLIFAGLGSITAARLPAASLRRSALLSILLAVLSSGLVFMIGIPSLLRSAAEIPIAFRAIILILCTAPSAYCMGFPIALAYRLIGKGGSVRQGPWLWAVNCWASVLGSFTTVLISRFYGYSAAFMLSCSFYLAAGAALSLLGRPQAGRVLKRR